MKRQKVTVFLLAAIWLVQLWLPAAAWAEAGDTIKAVKVNIVTSPPAPARIVRRIEASVKTVGQRLLVGREVSAVSESPGVYENLVQEVLDRVLAGYSVEKTSIAAGLTAVITVRLDSWGERVGAVKVDMEFSAADKRFVPLLQRELGDLEQSVHSMLLGLPVDSLDWADTIARSSVREIVEERLPEYRAAVDIIPGETTQVKMVFSPVGAVVREAAVSMRSATMPNILLYEMRSELDAFAKALRGLPAEFVVRKQQELASQAEAIVSAHPYKQAYLLDVRAELVPGPDTDINIRAESRRYRVNAEARLDMGREKSNTSGLLHAGKFVSPDDELYLEVGLVTNSMRWQISPGWSRQVGSNTLIGARVNVTDNIRYAWLEHHIGDNWRLRFDRSSKDNDDEIGIRYKLHDFLSAELVHRTNENFVRVIGQL